MFTANSVMTKDVITVSQNTPVYEAMRVLVENRITGLPVVSDDMSLLGMVSEKDMLKLLYETHIQDAPVAEVMTREVVSFDENDDVIDVCECLIDNHFRRIPILSEGRLAGIISRRDIIKFILKLRKTNNKPK